MFGVVPRPLWERRRAADDRNRIQLAMRPLLVEADWGRHDRRLRRRRQDGLRRAATSTGSIASAASNTRWPRPASHGESIDIVLATHLHFDHFGGGDGPQGRRRWCRDFRRARYIIRDAEWDDATHPHDRNRASYLQDDFVPLEPAGVVDFFEGDSDDQAGRARGAHRGPHRRSIRSSTSNRGAGPRCSPPTSFRPSAHLQDPWMTGYDLFPLETLAFKQRFIREAIDREYLIFFEHDPPISAGYIREKDGKRSVEKVL